MAIKTEKTDIYILIFATEGSLESKPDPSEKWPLKQGGRIL